MISTRTHTTTSKATLVNVLASSALVIQTITAFTLAVEGTRIIDANAACTANVKLLGALITVDTGIMLLDKALRTFACVRSDCVDT